VSLETRTWYVPVGHAPVVYTSESGASVTLPAANVDESACRHFLDKLLLKVEFRAIVAHNWKADLQVLKNFGVRIPRFSDKLWCSLVASWLAGWGADHKALALKKLGERLGFGKGDTFAELAKDRQAEDIPIEEIAPYAGRDAWLAVEVLKRAYKRLEEFDLARHYHEVDMPLVEVLRGAEEFGNPIDTGLLQELSKTLEAEALELRERFRELTTWLVDVPVKTRVETGEFFKNGKPKLRTVPVPMPTMQGADVGNDHQVARWLYDEMQLWPTTGLKLTGANHYPTDKDTVERFTALPGLGGELARLRLEYGKRSKILSTYIGPLLGLPPQYGDGLLHASYNLTGTETQRFSSARPNLQNLPSRTEIGRLIRKALIAPEGHEILVFDYSQIELRICAHLSQDPEMLRCYLEGVDVHQGTLDVMHEVWAGASRTDAKVTNFSTIYRITAPALAGKMHCSEHRAEASIEAFYKRFPRVETYHRQAIAFAKTRGYAMTIGDFKRFLDTTPKYNRRTRKMEMAWDVQNKAINTPIQGSAAEFAKRAMRDVHQTWVAKGVYGTLVWLVGQEHDSLIACARKDYVETAKSELKAAMENVWKLRVPLIAEGGSGPNWAEAKG
jgi:DNA polymerase-1